MKAHSRDGQGPFAGTCAWCGTEFGAWSPQAEYCSVAHKQAHYRWREKVVHYAKSARKSVDKLEMYLKQGGTTADSARKELEQTIQYAESVLLSSDYDRKVKKAKESK